MPRIKIRMLVMPLFIGRTYLCPEVLRRGVEVGIVGRDVNESIDIVLGNGIGDTLRAFDMDVLKVKVPCARLKMPASGRYVTYLVGHIRPTRLYTTSECRTLSSRDCVFRRSYS